MPKGPPVTKAAAGKRKPPPLDAAVAATNARINAEEAVEAAAAALAATAATQHVLDGNKWATLKFRPGANRWSVELSVLSSSTHHTPHTGHRARCLELQVIEVEEPERVAVFIFFERRFTVSVTASVADPKQNTHTHTHTRQGN